MSPQLAQTLALLPESERIVISLVHLEEMTMAESAQAMGLSLDCAQSLYSSAVTRIKEEMARSRTELRA